MFLTLMITTSILLIKFCSVGVDVAAFLKRFTEFITVWNVLGKLTYTYISLDIVQQMISKYYSSDFVILHQ